MSLKFNPLTSNFDYSGNGEPVATYSTFSAFPSTAIDGSLAVALDTDTLYVFNLSGTTWFPIGKPGDALSVGTIDTGSPSADGLKINASQAIIAQSASATFPGLVNNTTQSFSGNKTFTGVVVSPTFKSSSSNSATSGVLNFSSGDIALAWRNNANSSDIILAKNTSDSLTWNGNPFVTSSGNITGSAFISTNTASLPGSGLLRLGSSEMVVWRNTANSGDLALSKDSSDQLNWNGHPFITSAGALTATNFSGSSSGTNTGDQTITLTGGVTGSGTGSFVTTVITNANLTGPITSVGNATSVASQTGTGSTFVMNTSPTLITPNLGTPSALVGTNITGTASGLTAGTVTTNANLTGDVTSVGNATTVAKIQGTTVSGTTGTGNVVFSTSPTLVTPALGTPSALVGTNITGTASGLTAGTVTTNANLTGVITSVGNATSITSQTGTGSTFVVSTSPTIATATFTGTTSFPGSASINGTGMVTANAFISTSSNVATTGILRMSSGDAGVVFRNNANSGDVALAKNTSDALTWNGTAFLSSSTVLLAAAFPALTGDVTTSAGSLTTTVAKIAGTTVSGTTGTTNVVFSNSPTLVTPNLGTPSTLVGTNITGTASGLTAGTVTTNANLTGDITSVGNATTAAATQANIATLSRAAGVAVHGTNTNDSASAGFVGEFISSGLIGSNSFPAATGAWGDATSISLTAGDWDVSMTIQTTQNGATVTDVEIGISTTSGNSSSGLDFGDNALDLFPPTAATNSGACLGPIRKSLSATTTVYAKLLGSYAVATPKYTCRLSARRMR